MAKGMVCVDRVCTAVTMQEKKTRVGSQIGCKETVVQRLERVEPIRSGQEREESDGSPSQTVEYHEDKEVQ